MQKFIALFLLTGIMVSAANAQQPEVYLFDANRIASIQVSLKKGDVEIVKSVNWLLNEADKILLLKPGSVMDKVFSPPSGNQHDYMSLAPYFWPDLTKPDSLPYIRKDGQRNPMINKITDKKNLVDLGRNTHLLGLAYAITGKEIYATKAADYLKTWFVAPATKMNPNLTYAQAVLGVNDGRGIGIIETVSLSNVVDAMGLLQKSKALSITDTQTITAWFDQYLNWMLTSKNGTDERHAKNNHGIWYDMQVLSFSLFLHKNEFARHYCDSILKRIPVQVEPDGRLPLELERTTALGYSTFCLEAWFKTAILASRLGVDIWHYQTADGRGLQKALDWLIPFATGEKKWGYEQIKEYTEVDKMYFLLMQASLRYHSAGYKTTAQKLGLRDVELINLLYPGLE
ncbi:MAG: alginate lyase family protein [Bacteroidota bacterium]